ncbi:MAG TPA: bile acid:sodium symporter [Longimicrobiales bacterium]|nr:bile acid:sodium symporter [Longimicrobiales bacterium]
MAQLIPLLLKASIFGMVFAIGLRLSRDEATWVLRHPRALILGALAMFVIMPLVAALLYVGLRPDAPTGLILMATALSPIPPILPNKEMKAGAGAREAVGLMVAAGLLAIVIVPFGAEWMASWFGIAVDVPAGPTARIVVATVLLPVLAGLVVSGLAPRAAERLADPVAKLAGLLLVLAALPVLVQTAPAQWRLLGGGTLLAFLLFAVVGVVVGHVLGGPEANNRTVLAVSTASRHPGVTAAVALAVVPDAQGVLPGALLYLIVSVIVTGVYLAWRRRVSTPPATTAS